MVLSTTVCLQEIGGDDVVIVVMMFSILRISQTCFTEINSTLQPQNLTLLAKLKRCRFPKADEFGSLKLHKTTEMMMREPKSGPRMWGCSTSRKTGEGHGIGQVGKRISVLLARLSTWSNAGLARDTSTTLTASTRKWGVLHCQLVAFKFHEE
jgi:hypothetical protein